MKRAELEKNIDDMLDTEEDLKKWPALAGPLNLCAQIVRPPYLAADAEALHHQKQHRRLTKLTAGCGTAAMLFGILQLVFPRFVGSDLMAWLEVLAIVIAGVAVVLGLLSLRLANWLIERHKAERLRLAKFRFLINPSIWSGAIGAPEVQAQHLRAKVQEIIELKAEDIRREVKIDHPPDAPPERAGDQALADQSLAELVDYYFVKRLTFQSKFFHRCIESNERLDLFTRFVPPVLFFGSLVAVLIHFGFIRLGIVDDKHLMSQFFIFLAASLPAMANGVRTLRTSYEFARNSSRYRAKAFALDRLEIVLRNEKDPQSRLRKLWYCEDILDFEHREWCRLMIDSDWFG